MTFASFMITSSSPWNVTSVPKLRSDGFEYRERLGSLKISAQSSIVPMNIHYQRPGHRPCRSEVEC